MTAPGSVTPPGAALQNYTLCPKTVLLQSGEAHVPNFSFLLAPRCSVSVCVSVSVCIWGKGQSANNQLRFLMLLLRMNRKEIRM